MSLIKFYSNAVGVFSYFFLSLCFDYETVQRRFDGATLTNERTILIVSHCSVKQKSLGFVSQTHSTTHFLLC